MTEQEKLRAKRVDIERKVAELLKERQATALEGQRDPKVEARRSEQLAEIQRLNVQLADLFEAADQLAAERSSKEAAKAEKERIAHVKEAQRLAKLSIKAGDDLCAAVTKVSTAYDDFQNQRLAVSDELRAAGLPTMARSITHELRGQTLKQVFIAVNEKMARLLGLRPHIYGSRKTLGGIDTIKRLQPETWDQIAPDQVRRA